MFRIFRNPVFISAVALLLILTSCRGRRGHENRGLVVDTARVTELQGSRLLYEHHFAQTAGLRARPHHTVVVTLESDTGHENDTGGTGYDNVPYEILSAGWFSFCMEDDDGEAHYSVLKDSAGNQVARWNHGDASCEPVHLEAGNYDLEILHGKEGRPDDKADLVFLAPQAVTYSSRTAAAPGAMRSAANLRAASVATVQNVQVTRATALSDLMTNLPGYGWVLRKAGDALSSAATNTDSVLEIVDGNTARYTTPVANTFDPQKIVLYPRTVGTDMVRFSIGETYPAEGEAGWLSTGNIGYPVQHWVSPSSVAPPLRSITMKAGGGGHMATNYYGKALGKGSTAVNFKLTPNSTEKKSFKLSKSADSKSWVYFQSGAKLWLFGASDAGYVPSDTHELYLSNRLGSTTSNNFPQLFAGEAALFDQCYDATAGFPFGTRYMIVSKGEDLDVIWSQVYPDASGVRTVVTTAEARVVLYPQPGFQGNSLVVSRPPDSTSDALATCSNNAMLNDGTAQSFDIQTNDNTMTSQNYENKVLVRSNKCVGCNLQGFDGSNQSLGNSNLSESNLSNAKLSYATLTQTILKDADLTAADLSYATLTDANITGARLDSIDLTTTSGVLCMRVDTDPNTGQVVRPPTFNKSKMRGDVSERWCVYAEEQQQWARYDLYGAEISDWNIADVTLQNVLWSGATATGKAPSFSNVTISGSLQNANLVGAKFYDADMSGANLSGANLSNISVTGSIIYGKISETALTTFASAIMSGATLSGVVFPSGSHLENVDLSGADLSHASLQGAHLCGANISSAVLFGTDLAGAYLEHEPANTSCTKGTAASLSGANMQNAKLNGAHMQGAVMDNVTWYGTDATGANAIMTNVHMSHADLPGLNLQDAQMQGAVMTDTVLVNANMAGAVLSGADLSYANLKGAVLTSANLNGTTDMTTILTNAAISAAPTPTGKATIEVLDYKRTDQYVYYQQNYSATALPTLMTSHIICPDSNSGSCAGHWTVTATPNEPTSCTPVAATQYQKDHGLADDQGKVLQCTSKRHPR